MKRGLLFLVGMVLALGCARVMVEAPKEPIKVDISMRLDIYQHVQKDIDAIENIVSGSKDQPKAKDGSSSLMGYFLKSAYAQEEISKEVEEAALRRKERRPELVTWLQNGTVGENKQGMVEIRKQEIMTSQLTDLINAENNDRMIIYGEVAKKNNIPIEEVEKVYAKRLQNDAPAGTAIEVMNGLSGAYEWRTK